ncbi:MAG: HSP90 family protein [Lachnospiraceae bacterium]|nr:HSP90 family protein [Lachnospiraceae bacterium]
MEDFRFKVNLGGMIEILSDHLYSSPDVFIRELLQNGVDAITGFKDRMQGDSDLSDYEGKITIDIEEEKRLVFVDNGQGLNEQEIHQFLAIIGESSKRNLETRRIESDYIGRFGIGLLSCFMVADEITMITKSCKNNSNILKWCGKPDGTYTVEECEDETFQDNSGTKVILNAKKGSEEYFTAERIEELVKYYGMLLHIPVVINDGSKSKQINPVYLPWEGRKTNDQEMMLFGKLMFAEEFLDCIPFHSEEGNVSGVIYILKYSVSPGARMKHRIYLKNMLLTEKGDGLIPEWAVFTKCIINAMDLRPTASREGFYEDDMLEKAKENIEKSIIEYIIDIAENDKRFFKEFFRIHNLTLMSLALESPKLFETLIDYFEFETTKGILTGYELRNSKEELVYAPTRERYKQLSQLFFAQDKLLINVSYVHSLELLEGMGWFFDLEVSAVEEWEVEELMKDLRPDDADAGFDFLRAANKILGNYDCKAELKYFSPNNQPTFYLLDENILFKRQIEEVKSQADSMFFSMLDAFAEEIPDEEAATLYFNYNNPLVKKIVELKDMDMLKTVVEILYVQALQIGGFALHNNEMSMLNKNILELMERGIMNV